MFIKEVRSIAKTISIFFLIVAMVIPQTTWAVTEETREWFAQGSSELSQEEDFFNLTIKQEVLGLKDSSEIAFTFVVEFKNGEKYEPYAKQPYILFEDKEDKIVEEGAGEEDTGEEKITDKDGKIVLKSTQRVTIPNLKRGAEVKITEEVSDEDFSFNVESKFNDEENKKSNEVEEIIGGKDVIVFTNEYVEPVVLEVTPEVMPSEALQSTAKRKPTATPKPTITPIATTTGVDEVPAKIKTGWTTSGQSTYYLNKKGKKVTGWATIGSNDFYFDKQSGALVSGGWKKLGKNWYYLEPSGEHGVKGRVSVGWKSLNNKTYYFKKTGKPGAKGKMFYGLKKISGNIYYLGGKEDGSLRTGWRTINKKKYYFRKNGAMGVKGSALTSWNKLGGKVYCFSTSSKATERGKMLTGWVDIGGYRYLINSSGQPRKGWQKIGKKWYYFNATGGPGVIGRLNTGWITLKGKTYYMKKTGKVGVRGRMFTGFVKLGKHKYYFGNSNDGALRTGFQTIKGAKYYFRKGGNADGTKGQMRTGWSKIGDSDYYFYKDTGKMAASVTIDGVYIGKDGKAVNKSVVIGGSGEKTIKSLLKNAVKPVGSTLYIWGGGHPNDRGNDTDWCRAGLNPKWKKFYDKHGSSYDYNKYRFTSNNGLDCSGLVGWAVYNSIESKSGKTSTGYKASSTSTGMPAWYASNGWGTVKNGTNAAKFTPGDVVSRSGHVWIVLGQCEDGSVVIVHSTPQAGVQLAGSTTLSGSSDSEAIKLAQTYMKRYHSNVVNKFKLASIVGTSNLKNINRFQWDVSGKKLMKDPEGYLKKTPKQILKDIYGE